MADTGPYRTPFDYSIPVTSWPYWVRIRWPNTIAMLTLVERWDRGYAEV